MEQNKDLSTLLANDPIYQELRVLYPEVPLTSVEVIMKFEKVVSFMNSRREAKMTEHGLTSGRFYLLMLLKRTEPVHMLSPSELAKMAGVTRGTMTQFIDAIEKDGFVTRVEDPFDRRKMLVKLSEKGEAKIKEILPLYLESMVDYTKVLCNDEKLKAIDLLEKIATTFKAPEEQTLTEIPQS